MSVKLAKAMQTGRLTIIKQVSGEVALRFPSAPNFVLSETKPVTITDRDDITPVQINKSNIKRLLLDRRIAIVE